MSKINIIAEVGLNHNGEMELAEQLIKSASESGADIVKFQLYDPSKRPDIDSHKWKEVLLKSKITRRQVFQLKSWCDKYKVDFLASVFDEERVSWCEDIGVKAYKIASKRIYDDNLAEVIYATKKPVILSYGMCEEGKIPSIIKTILKNYKYKNDRSAYLDLIKMYCVSKYPANFEDIHFMYDRGRQLNFVDLSINVPVAYSIFESTNDFQGYSDHCIGLTACKAALSLGAKLIEKHFTLDKSMPGPDHFHSCTPEELFDLCKFRDEVDKILYKN